MKKSQQRLFLGSIHHHIFKISRKNTSRPQTLFVRAIGYSWTTWDWRKWPIFLLGKAGLFLNNVRNSCVSSARAILRRLFLATWKRKSTQNPTKIQEKPKRTKNQEPVPGYQLCWNVVWLYQRMDGCMDAWMDGRMDGSTATVVCYQAFCSSYFHACSHVAFQQYDGILIALLYWSKYTEIDLVGRWERWGMDVQLIENSSRAIGAFFGAAFRLRVCHRSVAGPYRPNLIFVCCHLNQIYLYLSIAP